MTIDQAIVFAIIAGLMVLFVWEKIRYDLAALLGLLAAVGTGIVPVDKAFGGFSDQVVIIVASALIISAGVSKSGVIARLIRRAEPYMRTPGTQVFVLATSVALLSSFMKNIGALAIFLPVALQIARRSGTSASKLLMPMAFASLLGGVVTLVGTSPNILVSRIRQEVIGKPFEMFDFAPVGLGILVAGLGFLTFGWRLLPAGQRAQASAQDAFQVDAYIVEASVQHACNGAGRLPVRRLLEVGPTALGYRYHVGRPAHHTILAFVTSFVRSVAKSSEVLRENVGCQFLSLRHYPVK